MLDSIHHMTLKLLLNRVLRAYLHFLCLSDVITAAYAKRTLPKSVNGLLHYYGMKFPPIFYAYKLIFGDLILLCKLCHYIVQIVI